MQVSSSIPATTAICFCQSVLEQDTSFPVKPGTKFLFSRTHAAPHRSAPSGVKLPGQAIPNHLCCCCQFSTLASNAPLERGVESDNYTHVDHISRYRWCNLRTHTHTLHHLDFLLSVKQASVCSLQTSSTIAIGNNIKDI